MSKTPSIRYIEGKQEAHIYQINGFSKHLESLPMLKNFPITLGTDTAYFKLVFGEKAKIYLRISLQSKEGLSAILAVQPIESHTDTVILSVEEGVSIDYEIKLAILKALSDFFATREQPNT